jgi:hypothetical protein
MTNDNYDNLISALRQSSKHSESDPKFVTELQAELMTDMKLAKHHMQHQLSGNKIFTIIRLQFLFSGFVGLSMGIMLTLLAWQLSSPNTAMPVDTYSIATDAADSAGSEMTLMAPEAKINPQYFQEQVGFEVSQPNIDANYQLLVSEPSLFNNDGKANAVSWTYSSITKPELTVKVIQSITPIYQAAQSIETLSGAIPANYFACSAIYAPDYCAANKTMTAQQTIYWQPNNKTYTLEVYGDLSKSEFIQLAKSIY